MFNGLQISNLIQNTNYNTILKYPIKISFYKNIQLRYPFTKISIQKMYIYIYMYIYLNIINFFAQFDDNKPLVIIYSKCFWYSGETCDLDKRNRINMTGLDFLPTPSTNSIGEKHIWEIKYLFDYMTWRSNIHPIYRTRRSSIHQIIGPGDQIFTRSIRHEDQVFIRL